MKWKERKKSLHFGWLNALSQMKAQTIGIFNNFFSASIVFNNRLMTWEFLHAMPDDRRKKKQNQQ